jgi:hypothetical protein
MWAAAASDVQKDWIEVALDEQKACIKEIKGHMSKLQDGMKVIHDELRELKAKPRNRNVCSPSVAVIIFVTMICFMKLLSGEEPERLNARLLVSQP